MKSPSTWQRIREAAHAAWPFFLKKLGNVILAALNKKLTMLLLSKVLLGTGGFKLWLAKFLVDYCSDKFLIPLFNETVTLGIYTGAVINGKMKSNDVKKAEVTNDKDKWNSALDNAFK